MDSQHVGLTVLINKAVQAKQTGNRKRKGPENKQTELGEPTYSDAAAKINVKKSAEQSINKEESGILISGLLTESRRTWG
jgi:hypothetical protein